MRGTSRTHAHTRPLGRLSRWAARRRQVGCLGIGLLLSLSAFGLSGALPGVGTTAQAAGSAGSATPSRFDPVSRATSPESAPAAQPAGASGQGTVCAHTRRPAPPAGRPATVGLDPAQPAHLTSADSGLDVDVPAGAVTPADVAAAGGKMSLLLRQVVPASGSSAGGSGHVTFGTFLVQVLDAQGHLATQGLRQPLGVKLHYGTRGGAIDVRHAVAFLNRPLPPWVSLDPAAAPATAGPVP